MAHADEDSETTLPCLAEMPLSQLNGKLPASLRESLRLLKQRLEGDQEPLNSFNASI
jgi:hypothetical protein